MDMRTVRSIVKNKVHYGQTSGGLLHPLFVVLAGDEVCSQSTQILDALHTRWTNTASGLFVLRFRFSAVESFGIASDGCFVINTAQYDDNGIKAQLTLLVWQFVSELSGVSSFANTDACFIISDHDPAARWAAPISMLLNYALIQRSGSLRSNRLFCLLDGPDIRIRSRLTELKQRLQAWNTGVPDEPLFYYQREDGSPDLAPLDGYYAASAQLFRHIVLLSGCDDRGHIYNQDTERLDMLLCLLDPCSEIQWPATPGFVSGYVYPNQAEPGVDVALLWRICHRRFTEETTRAVVDLAPLAEANRQLSEVYYQQQEIVYSGMGGFCITNAKSDSLFGIALDSKQQYLWRQRLNSPELKAAEHQWRKSFRKTLSTVWSSRQLAECRDRLRLAYVRSADRDRTVPFISGNLREVNEALIHVLYDLYASDSDKSLRLVNGRVEELNRWAEGEIEARAELLRSLETDRIDSLQAEADALCLEFGQQLDAGGHSSQEAMDRREQALSRRDDLVDPLLEVYKQAVCSDNYSKGLQHFVNEAAEALSRAGLSLAPMALDMPNPQDVQSQRLACQMSPKLPAVVQDTYPVVAGGMDKGRYYFLRGDIPVDTVTDFR